MHVCKLDGENHKFIKIGTILKQIMIRLYMLREIQDELNKKHFTSSKKNRLDYNGDEDIFFFVLHWKVATI